jgi:undecaprenyl-diphosphatase
MPGDTDAGSWVRRRADLVALLAAVALIVLSTIIASQGVSDLEADVFHAVNGLPEALRTPMWAVQFLGVLLVPAAVAVVALAFRKWRLSLALVLLIPLKLLVEKGILKEIVYRARPGTSVCDGDLECLNVRDVPVVGPSFPSGHVIIAFGIAWLVAPYLPRRWRWVVSAIAALVAISRVYLGAHNPLDVLAGSAAGLALGALLNLLVGIPREDPAESAPASP